FNHLIRLRVSVKVITQLSRVVMGWRAVAEGDGGPRWRKRGRLIARLWWIVAANIFSLALPVSLVAKVGLGEILGINGKAHADGVEAAHIIFNRWAWIRWMRDQCFWLLLGFLPILLLLV